MNEGCERRDLARPRVLTGMLLVTAALIGAQFVAQSHDVWFEVTLLLAWAGFCAVNAWRCGRLHCYITAPVFLAGAAGILLTHFGVWKIPPQTVWLLVGAGVLLSCGAEGFLGKYATKGASRT